MGVTQLWQILSPVQEHQTLASLKGLVLAVDLSIWICESDGVRNMQGVVTKPHLRNLFFRILHLTQLGVKLVFVIEGVAPELKWDTMAKRQQNRFPARQGKQTTSQKPAGKQSRKNFNAILKECCELLDILGIPYIQSTGEAEAMCAVLNSSGLVDGCLTDDGDAFLYGAQTVYRNFTMNAKDPHVECYRVADIESQLGIDRNGLVALALLLGCDFVPKGVPGIGMANAVKLMECLRGKNVLERLQDWRKIHESQCVDPIEKMVRKKALNALEFPQIEVIHEFLNPKDRCPSRLSPWKRPVPVKFQEFALQKLDWPLEYTLEKILPLVTLWDMQDVLQSKNPSNHQHLRPHRIVKTRVRQGIPCFEIEWHKPVTDPYYTGDYYVTIETQEMFAQCYPAIVRLFQGETTSKNKKKKAKKKKNKEKSNESINQNSVDNLSFNFGKLNLKTVTNRLQESVRELKPSFTEYEGSSLTTKVKQSSVSQPTHQVVQSSSELQSNCFRDLKPNQVLSPSISEISDIPLSDRLKLRLHNKQQQKQTDYVDMVCKGIKDLNVNNNHSLGKRKKKKRPSIRINESLTESPVISNRINSLKNSGVGSPVSPFVCESMPSQRTVQVDNMRKMSSPSSTNTFCSPVSFMKQSIQHSSEAVFKDSPIQNTSLTDDSSQQKRTMTNFKFFDTPSRDENHTATTKPTSTNSIHKTNTPSILKGEWQTEFIESYIHELSKDFSLSANRSLQHDKQTGFNNSAGKTINQPNINTNQLTMDATQEINFKLQSSLLDSLCASLIQTLTPKGMNKEQYESLCESLKKLEQEGTDLMGLKDLPCNLDFSDFEELSSSFKIPNLNKPNSEKNQSNNKGNTQKGVKLKDSKIDSVNCLGKSARKRLRKKQKGNINISTVTEQKTSYKEENVIKHHGSAINGRKSQDFLNSQSQDVANFSLVDLEFLGRNAKKCSSIGANNRNSLNVSKTISVPEQGKSIISGGDNHNCENEINGKTAEVSSSDTSKKKKKNKKKKMKKTFSDMDLSADTSAFNEFQLKMCSEYLKKALEGSSKSKSQPKKIEKASPVIDLSVDETFLELEVLSGNLANSASTTNTEAKRKLALKRKISKKSKEEKGSQCVSGVDQGHLAQSQNPPVLSINAAMSTTSNFSGNTYHQERSPHKASAVFVNHQNGPDIDSNHESKVEAIRQKRVCNQAIFDFAKANDMMVKNHVECGNANRYDRDFLEAMEEVMARASPALLSPKSPGKTCSRLRQRLSDNELSPKAAAKERCKSKRSPPYCRMNTGLVSNEIGIPDTFERNIQSCKDLRSWSVLPKMISKEYLRCQSGISGSFMNYRLQSKYQHEDSELFESAAKMYCNMNEKHVRNIGIEMEKIDSELKATNKQSITEANSDLDILDSDIDNAIDNVCKNGKNKKIECELKTANKQKTVEIDSDLSKSDKETDETRDDEVCKCNSNGNIDSDTDIKPHIIEKTGDVQRDWFNKTVEKIRKNESGDDTEPSTDSDVDNGILTAKFDKVCIDTENSDSLSDASENVDNAYSSCTEDFITENTDNHALFKEDSNNDFILVDNLTENDVCETSPEVSDATNECSSISTITEQLQPTYHENITTDAAVTENEGSSDKENEKVSVKKDFTSTTDRCTGSTQDIPALNSSSLLSGPGKMEDCSSTVASPIPLLDRLKMKFKKSSARNVLQTFTNGR